MGRKSSPDGYRRYLVDGTRFKQRVRAETTLSFELSTSSTCSPVAATIPVSVGSPVVVLEKLARLKVKGQSSGSAPSVYRLTTVLTATSSRRKIALVQTSVDSWRKLRHVCDEEPGQHPATPSGRFWRSHCAELRAIRGSTCAWTSSASSSWRSTRAGPMLRSCCRSRPARPGTRARPAATRRTKSCAIPAGSPAAQAREWGAEPMDPSDHTPMGVAKIPLAGNGFALHGGANPIVVGKPVSLGCVRLSDPDMLALLAWLDRAGALAPGALARQRRDPPGPAPSGCIRSALKCKNDAGLADIGRRHAKAPGCRHYVAGGAVARSASEAAAEGPGSCASRTRWIWTLAGGRGRARRRVRADAFDIVFNGPSGYGIDAATAANAEAAGVPIIEVASLSTGREPRPPDPRAGSALVRARHPPRRVAQSQHRDLSLERDERRRRRALRHLARIPEPEELHAVAGRLRDRRRRRLGGVRRVRPDGEGRHGLLLSGHISRRHRIPATR